MTYFYFIMMIFFVCLFGCTKSSQNKELASTKPNKEIAKKSNETPSANKGIEEAKYKVVKKDRNFEIREYEAHILAETIVDGNLENAGNKAFNLLFRYISGKNKSKQKVAMTAPVSQKASGETINMTAPVEQKRVHDKWAVSFMMPSTYTMETLPEPIDLRVTLRQVPAMQIAAINYSGTWNEKSYGQNKAELEKWILENKLKTTGEPIWARYDSPFTLWFLRRNEILFQLMSEKDE